MRRDMLYQTNIPSTSKSRPLTIRRSQYQRMKPSSFQMTMDIITATLSAPRVFPLPRWANHLIVPDSFPLSGLFWLILLLSDILTADCMVLTADIVPSWRKPASSRPLGLLHDATNATMSVTAPAMGLLREEFGCELISLGAVTSAVSCGIYGS